MEMNISKILQVAESLEDIVCRCFGPCGGQVLVIKSTGDLLITKDGKTILESLLLDHPVARIIVSSASQHYSIAGDGVKSFIILLCGVLRELKVIADKNEGLRFLRSSHGKNKHQTQGPLLKRMSNMLMTFQTGVLEPIIVKYLSPHFHSVFSTLGKETILSKDSLQLILDAYFCGKIGYANHMFISSLASEFLYKCLLSDFNIIDVVKLVSNCFPELHTEVTGLPVENSRVLPGLLLHRHFSVYCPAEGELRALIVTEQIHQSLSTSDIDFLVSSEAQLLFSEQYLRERTENIMKHFRNNQVKLILSSVKQPEIVLYFAKEFGISIVDCLPSEEIDLVYKFTGVAPLSVPIRETFLGHITDTFIVLGCRPILLGSRKYVHLSLNVFSNLKPHCVVLCGPVKGFTEQLVSSFSGAFIMLRHLFQQWNANVEYTTARQRCKLSETISLPEQSLFCDIYRNDSAYYKCELQTVYPSTNINSTNKEVKTSLEHIPEGCTHNLNKQPQKNIVEQVCLNQEDESLQHICGFLENESSNVETISESSCTKVSSVTTCKLSSLCDITEQLHSATSVKSGVLVPGGGTFEMLLHYYLHHFGQKCDDTELALLCRLVGNALLSIPKHICRRKKRNASFARFYAQFVNTLQGEGDPETIETDFESLSCKYQLVASVFHCISKLVAIDFILATKKVSPKAKCESDEDL
ncbi:Bardet-Biedl syndrome 10 protein [Bombina bombina]|uniref:Bardet-Biedl syndrome 10 protein n=1 Tax=Bombina bombina TaxID=8345 RepID=UPI00235AC535|nr:Bardet-Biedl syndrome 10 protein [Bombina bombina]